MSFDDIERLTDGQTVAFVLAWFVAAAAFVFFVVKLWPVVAKFVETINALSVLPEKLRLLDEIHHEVRPNTGTSMNDSVRRTERLAINLDNRVAALEQTAADQTTQINGLQELMESGDSELAERVDDIESTLTREK